MLDIVHKYVNDKIHKIETDTETTAYTTREIFYIHNKYVN